MESLDHIYVWVRAAKHAPRCWCYIIERRHGLAEIVEDVAMIRAVRRTERPPVDCPHCHREVIVISENASSHGYKALLRSTLPVAQRVLGESHDLTLTMRKISAAVLCNDPGATLDDMREAVTTLEESERVARRVYGGAHPLASGIEHALRNARAALRVRETPPSQNNDSL